MRKISAWVAIAAVPTMIAGHLRDELPPHPRARGSYVGDTGVYYGYFVALALMIAVCVGLFRAFKRSGWL